jgi:hypothetical protein
MLFGPGTGHLLHNGCEASLTGPAPGQPVGFTRMLVCGLPVGVRPPSMCEKNINSSQAAYTPALLMTRSMCLRPGQVSLKLLAQAWMLLGSDTSSVVMCSLRWPSALGGCCCCSACSCVAVLGLRTAAMTVLSFSQSCRTNSSPMPCGQSTEQHVLGSCLTAQLCNMVSALCAVGMCRGAGCGSRVQQSTVARDCGMCGGSIGLAWLAPVTTIVFWDRTAFTSTAAAMLLRLLLTTAALKGAFEPLRSLREARQRALTVFWCTTYIPAVRGWTTGPDGSDLDLQLGWCFWSSNCGIEY